MATVQTLTRRFERVFEPEQAVVLAETIRQFLQEHNLIVVQTFEW